MAFQIRRSSREPDIASDRSTRYLLFVVAGRSLALRLHLGTTIAHLSTPPMTQLVPRDDVTARPAVVGYDTHRLDQMGKLVRDGAVRPAVSRVFPFSAIKAYELMPLGHVRGKIVLDMRKTG